MVHMKGMHLDFCCVTFDQIVVVPRQAADLLQYLCKQSHEWNCMSCFVFLDLLNFTSTVSLCGRIKKHETSETIIQGSPSLCILTQNTFSHTGFHRNMYAYLVCIFHWIVGLSCFVNRSIGWVQHIDYLIFSLSVYLMSWKHPWVSTNEYTTIP